MTKELLDNQPSTDTPKFLKVALVVVAVVLAAFLSAFGLYQYRHSDPYVESVLALTGSVEQGRFIFQMNCSTCHGLYGDGQVGPSLHHVSSRKSRIGLITQVVSGKTPPMPQFQPSPQEMADLLKYLESL